MSGGLTPCLWRGGCIWIVLLNKGPGSEFKLLHASFHVILITSCLTYLAELSQELDECTLSKRVCNRGMEGQSRVLLRQNGHPLLL